MSLGRNRPVAGHRFGKAETGVRSAVAAPSMSSWQCTRGETVDAAASEAAAATAWRFKSFRVHQYCSLRQAAKASVLHTDIPRFESWSEHHTTRFVSLAAKAPARHAGDPRFESATKHQHLSRSSKAERPADNRKTAVRYRAGEPSTRARRPPWPPRPNRGGLPPHLHRRWTRSVQA